MGTLCWWLFSLLLQLPMQPTMNSKVQQNVFVVLNLCVDWGVGFFVERWLCKWRMVEFFFSFLGGTDIRSHFNFDPWFKDWYQKN